MPLTLQATLLLFCSNVFMTFAWQAFPKEMSNRPWLIAVRHVSMQVRRVFSQPGQSQPKMHSRQGRCLQVPPLLFLLPLGAAHTRRPYTWP
jgi:hypothetical protein